jgi:hypothetical protein
VDEDRPAVVSERDSGTDSVQRAEPEAEAKDIGRAARGGDSADGESERLGE